MWELGFMPTGNVNDEGAKPVVVPEHSEEFGLQRHNVKVIIVPVEGYHQYLVIKSKGRRVDVC